MDPNTIRERLIRLNDELQAKAAQGIDVSQPFALLQQADQNYQVANLAAAQALIDAAYKMLYSNPQAPTPNMGAGQNQAPPQQPPQNQAPPQQQPQHYIVQEYDEKGNPVEGPMVIDANGHPVQGPVDMGQGQYMVRAEGKKDLADRAGSVLSSYSSAAFEILKNPRDGFVKINDKKPVNQTLISMGIFSLFLAALIYSSLGDILVIFGGGFYAISSLFFMNILLCALTSFVAQKIGSSYGAKGKPTSTWTAFCLSLTPLTISIVLAFALFSPGEVLKSPQGLTMGLVVNIGLTTVLLLAGLAFTVRLFSVGLHTLTGLDENKSLFVSLSSVALSMFIGFCVIVALAAITLLG